MLIYLRRPDVKRHCANLEKQARQYQQQCQKYQKRLCLCDGLYKATLGEAQRATQTIEKRNAIEHQAGRQCPEKEVFDGGGGGFGRKAENHQDIRCHRYQLNPQIQQQEIACQYHHLQTQQCRQQQGQLLASPCSIARFGRKQPLPQGQEACSDNQRAKEHRKSICPKHSFQYCLRLPRYKGCIEAVGCSQQCQEEHQCRRPSSFGLGEKYIGQNAQYKACGQRHFGCKKQDIFGNMGKLCGELFHSRLFKRGSKMVQNFLKTKNTAKAINTKPTRWFQAIFSVLNT